MSEPSYITLLIETIGRRYADLRIIQPAAEKSMERSMQRHGQLTPVVVGSNGDGYEMVDGFKRLRAGRNRQFNPIFTSWTGHGMMHHKFHRRCTHARRQSAN